MDSYIKPDTRSALSDERERVFIQLCEVFANLRNRLYFNDQSNPKVQTSYEFRRLFDQLFILSSDNKDIDAKLKTKIRAWLKATNPLISAGLDLFEQYKEQLFKFEIIKYG